MMLQNCYDSGFVSTLSYDYLKWLKSSSHSEDISDISLIIKPKKKDLIVDKKVVQTLTDKQNTAVRAYMDGVK